MSTDSFRIVWPEIPRRQKAVLLSMQFQLDHTQWWPAERIKDHQFQQLAEVFRHAYASVPFYRHRLAAVSKSIDLIDLKQAWQTIPILTRSEVQDAGDQIHSSDVPPEHGRTRSKLTSGSTGQPLVCLGTSLTQLIWRCITLRDHLWHKRDFARKLAVIRYTKKGAASPPDGAEYPDWGPPANLVTMTGPSVLLSTESNVTQQAEWLRRHEPSYLVAYPSNLMALADLFIQDDITLSNLLEVRSFGECLDERVRVNCRQAWNVRVTDCYSSQEVGYIALQCPHEDVYHIQSESAFVEILKDDNTPCCPGEVGRVVVTTLHNAAMPLIRYDLQDFAEVGEPCSCGRGLPVVRRVVGRQRNMVMLPNGEKRWPGFGHGDDLDGLPPIRQYQVVQVSIDEIELRLVQPSRFTPEEEKTIKKYVQQTLGYPFGVTLRYVDDIGRSRSGKFEEFRCELED